MHVLSTPLCRVVIIFCLFLWNGIELGASAANPLDNWTDQNSEPAEGLTAITYGQGMFVAVGAVSTILTSTNGSDWTSRTSGTSGDLNGVTYGNGRFVAVGRDELFRGTVSSSLDGLTWTNSELLGHALYCVTSGNGLFVAAGDVSTIATSTDGVVWTNHNPSFGNGYWIYGLTFANGLFVAVGGSRAGSIILTSTNGTNWVSRNSGPRSDLKSITYGGGMFLVVGTYSRILTSTDGSTWSNVTSSSHLVLNAVAYGNGKFVVTSRSTVSGGDFGDVLTSPDGISWERHTLGTDYASPTGIVYAESAFMLVTGHGEILRSGSFAPATLAGIKPTSTGTMELTIVGEIGRTYHLQASTTVASPTWTDLFTFSNNQDTLTTFVDTKATNILQRFYRVTSP